MKTESLNKIIKKVLKLKWVLLVLFVVIGYLFIFRQDTVMSPMKESIENYKVKNLNYGIIPNLGQSYNCFVGNTFVKDKAFQEVLLKVKMDDMYCRFKVDETNKTLTAWSLSIQIGDKVHCIDSNRNETETPGVTLTTSCKGE